MTESFKKENEPESAAVYLEAECKLQEWFGIGLYAETCAHARQLMKEEKWDAAAERDRRNQL